MTEETIYQAELFPLISHLVKSNSVQNNLNLNFSLNNKNKQNNLTLTSNNLSSSSSSTSKLNSTKVTLPAIPPKKITISTNFNNNKDNLWYFVRSPREEYGPQGPYQIEELKQFKKIGIIKDSTLMWQEGLKIWLPLATLTSLKNDLIKLPPVPDRHSEQAAYDPVALPPTRQEIISCEKLDISSKCMVSRYCSKCGITAVGHLRNTIHEQDIPELTPLRRTVGSYQNASEIIPGLLWIGNASTGRSKFFQDLGADLILNCTANLKTPDSKPPYYRCATIPLPEEKSDDRIKSPALSRTNSSMISRTNTIDSARDNNNNNNDLTGIGSISGKFNSNTLSRTNSVFIPQMEIPEVLEWFEKCYDFIENVRLYPDRAREGDPAPPDWTGPVDRYGRPIRSKEEQAIATATRKLLDPSEGRDKRVLLWSRLGFDRPCVLAAAYIIRRWGLSVENALEYVRKARKGMKISDHYMLALEKYSESHVIGQLLCQDCLTYQTIPLKIVKKENDEKESFRIVVPKNSAQEIIYQQIQTEFLKFPNLHEKFDKDLTTYFYFHRQFPHRSDNYMLMDVKINGKLLNDDDFISIINIFVGASILGRLQLMDFSNNLLTCTGITYLCETLDNEPNSELTTLLLANNKIRTKGAQMITQLLQSKYSIHTINLSNNLIGDQGGASIIHALILPEKDLFESEEYKDPDSAANSSLYGKNTSSKPNQQQQQQQQQQKHNHHDDDNEHLIKNCTLTDLDISNNNIGQETLESLAIVMKSNPSLLTLRMDCLFQIGNESYINHVFNECRVFNQTFKILSLTDTPISVNTFDHIMRIFDGTSVLQKVYLSRCNITAMHMRQSFMRVESSNYLTHITLSGNKLTDQGLGFITDVLNSRHSNKPPLEYLDINTCQITISSAIGLFQAISTKQTMKYLDISDNNLRGPISLLRDISDSVGRSSLEHLNISRCQIGGNGSNSLLTSLETNKTLKILNLAENEIKDSIDTSLSIFLENNQTLEVLDLGFNDISSRGIEKSKRSLKVLSSSILERKLNELHINLVGNKCGPYELEFPGMARSKLTLRYGTERLDDESHHIQQSGFNDYWERRKFVGKLNSSKWTEINNIT